MIEVMNSLIEGKRLISPGVKSEIVTLVDQDSCKITIPKFLSKNKKITEARCVRSKQLNRYNVKTNFKSELHNWAKTLALQSFQNHNLPLLVLEILHSKRKKHWKLFCLSVSNGKSVK